MPTRDLDSLTDKLAALDIVQAHHRGKVRDIYDLGDTLLIVTSDRISAFDVVFEDIIPNKGKVLNQISALFFQLTADIIPNHFISADVADYPSPLQAFAAELEDRSMLVRKTRVVPFECIARGYITGSAWGEYGKHGTVNGEKMAAGLVESQAFASPLFTPSTKATEGHDENISYATMKRHMDIWLAEKLRHTSLALYRFGHDFLAKRGIVLADSKFEFGTLDGQVVLIDELLTPDSSRFWDAADYQQGRSQKSFDKQYVRDYLTQAGWNKQPPAPRLPTEVIERTFEKYYAAYKAIAGSDAKTWV
ncbi:MAG: phosphoribosylaminoimidazolesuccinocarboxamide synthase [Candidatus Cloacimonetes bacterium]|nr:phosphoribosylaminoimidazolesuccinocarboxamide synthase [Candidatus Cloacimonadota bacterium]